MDKFAGLAGSRVWWVYLRDFFLTKQLIYNNFISGYWFFVAIWSEFNLLCHHSAFKYEAPGNSSTSPAMENLLFFQRLQSLPMLFYSSEQTHAHASFHTWVHAVLSTQEECEDSKTVNWVVRVSVFANPDFPHFSSCDIIYSLTWVYGKVLSFRQTWQLLISPQRQSGLLSRMLLSCFAAFLQFAH